MYMLAFCVIFGERFILYLTTYQKPIMPFFSIPMPMYGSAVPSFVWIFLFKVFHGNSVVLMYMLAFRVLFGEKFISYLTTGQKPIMPFFSIFIPMYLSAIPNFVWIFLYKGFHGSSVDLMYMLEFCVFFGESVISYHTTCQKHIMQFFSIFIPMYGSAIPNFVVFSCSRVSMETVLSWCTCLHFVWFLVKGSRHILLPVKSPSCCSSSFSSPCMVVQFSTLFGYSCPKDSMETVLSWCTCLHFVWFLVKGSYHI
jgi:hypothetical protein